MQKDTLQAVADPKLLLTNVNIFTILFLIGKTKEKWKQVSSTIDRSLLT